MARIPQTHTHRRSPTPPNYIIFRVSFLFVQSLAHLPTAAFSRLTKAYFASFANCSEFLPWGKYNMSPVERWHNFVKSSNLLYGSFKFGLGSVEKVLLHSLQHGWDCRRRLCPGNVPCLRCVSAHHSGLAALYISRANLQSQRNALQFPIVELPARCVICLFNPHEGNIALQPTGSTKANSATANKTRLLHGIS